MAIDELRERRELKRGERADEVAAAQAELAAANMEALRQIGQPNIVVNVEPTPVTIENTVNVPETPPLQLTLTEPLETPEPPKRITIKRDPRTGLIESALVEED